MTDTAVLDQRGQESVVTQIARRAWRDLDHSQAIGITSLVELLDESKGQSAGGGFLVLTQATSHLVRHL
jgi:hypothetical protein